MPFTDPPRCAAWQHRDARGRLRGRVHSARTPRGCRIEGHTAAVEDGEAWAVRYDI